MIIKGKSRGNAGQLAAYLLTKGKNEKVGYLAAANVLDNETLKGALLEMQETAALTNCEKFLYHASINPKEGEQLTPKQWEKSITSLEKNLGLVGHQKAVVIHEKDGRRHMHIVWNRVHPEELTAKRMSWNYIQHEQTARELEKDFGLDRVQGVHVDNDGPRHNFGPKQWETEKGKRGGIDPRRVKADISTIWERSDSGQAFAAALQSEGYILAKGDRKPFVIIDEKGGIHGVNRSAGVRLHEVRAKLEDISPSSLPTVDQAREMQTERDKIKASQKTATGYEQADMVGQQRAAMDDLKARSKAREAEEAKKALLERQKAGNRKKESSSLDKIKEAKKAWLELEKNNKRENENYKADKQGGGHRAKSTHESARDDRDARREMTDARRKKQSSRVQELFDRSFRGEKRDNAFERERERER